LSRLAILAALVLLCAPAFADEEKKEQEPEYKNTVRWKTASEVDNFGFDVFRSTTEDGEFECINETTLEGAGTSDLPHDYAFVDDTIDPDQEYFYYVESISMDGVREQFTPIIRAKPKRSSRKSADGNQQSAGESKDGKPEDRSGDHD